MEPRCYALSYQVFTHVSEDSNIGPPISVWAYTWRRPSSFKSFLDQRITRLYPHLFIVCPEEATMAEFGRRVDGGKDGGASENWCSYCTWWVCLSLEFGPSLRSGDKMDVLLEENEVMLAPSEPSEWSFCPCYCAKPSYTLSRTLFFCLKILLHW